MSGAEGHIGLDQLRGADGLSGATEAGRWVAGEEALVGGERGPVEFLTTLERTQRAAVIPYGYTLCVWSGSALLVDAGHRPGVAGVLGYSLGAVAGFMLLRQSTAGHESAIGGGGGALHVIPILVVVASIALIGRMLGDPWVWEVSGTAVTATYFLTVAAQSWLVARARGTMLNRRVVHGQHGGRDDQERSQVG